MGVNRVNDGGNDDDDDDDDDDKEEKKEEEEVGDDNNGDDGNGDGRDDKATSAIFLIFLARRTLLSILTLLSRIKMAVDPATAYAVVAGSLILIILIVTLISKFSQSSSKDEKKPAATRAGPAGVARAAEGPRGIRRRGPRVNRMRRDEEDSDEDLDLEDDPVDVAQSEGKIGAKKMRKLQEKAERKAMREQEERDREERKKRQQELDQQRKQQEEIEKQEAAIREEEERIRKEEQEKREHEEYLKMKEMFSVDEEGEGEQEADLNSESLLGQFINYIKETKVVMLEDLAGHFKLKTQDVIQRVQDLQAEGRLTGVIDDRGKFIYITMEELEAVARYIRQNGRVSISDLAASSNRLISLDPDTSTLAAKMAAEVAQMVDVEEVAA
ncbi:Ddrgk domain-containing protein 1 [Plakobranchus ocellatus]|uniref:DDRGK domain-containing protein 1 n=1 Tax=Plakobranchus ocellatus TaxID=259542 RepID=A0AAV4AKI6_9GAST|nr:Ddrgk domain-containing protein 1 [Plakobranchus ocellatus]